MLVCNIIVDWRFEMWVDIFLTIVNMCGIFEKEIGEVCWCSSLNDGFYGSSNGLNQKSPTSILIIPFVINMFIKMKIFWHDDFF